MGIGLFGGAGGGLTGPAADGGTPTPVTPAWTMVTPAQWAAATETYSPSGPLTVEPSDDPAWTFKTSFTETTSDTGIFELDIDMTPYVYNDRCTVLVEFGPRPTDRSWETIMVGIRAAGETEVVIGGLGHSAQGQPRTRVYQQKRNVNTNAVIWATSLSDYSPQAWFTGLAADINVGNAAESPTVWPRPMGTPVLNNSVWPAWLDLANPRVGDFVGIAQYRSPSGQGLVAFRPDAPRTPATAERKLVCWIGGAENFFGSGPWTDWYHRVAIVNP